MPCDNPDHERFSGVFDLPKGCHGCLACFAEKQAKEIRDLKSLLRGLARRHEWDPHFDQGCVCKWHVQWRLLEGMVSTSDD